MLPENNYGAEFLLSSLVLPPLINLLDYATVLARNFRAFHISLYLNRFKNVFSKLTTRVVNFLKSRYPVSGQKHYPALPYKQHAKYNCQGRQMFINADDLIPKLLIYRIRLTDIFNWTVRASANSATPGYDLTST